MPDDQLLNGWSPVQPLPRPIYSAIIRKMSDQIPIKRSITILGHRTSISIELIFWDALKDAADEEGLSFNALISRIDQERPGNLSSAIRVWLFERLHLRTQKRP